MNRPVFRIGARGSPLSLAQTGLVRDRLASANPDADFEIVPIVTTGDRIQDRALNALGGKGLFTKELDEALLAGRVDLAVHSMKDLPTVLPEGVCLAAAPEREDPSDVLISRARVARLQDLPEGARIGSASLRRQAQLLAIRPDLQVAVLRGNVETRLLKLAAGEVDATLLAGAGLRRLGLDVEGSAPIPPSECLPAAGQGALALTARTADAPVLERLARVEDVSARLEVEAERGFLAALDGSCRTPIAALGRWSAGRLVFEGEALTSDGRLRWRRAETIETSDLKAARDLGERLGASVRREAGDRLETSA